MILLTDTDDAYLGLPAARSHITGHYYFKNHMLNYSKVNTTPNWPILKENKALKTMVSSSAEA